MSEVQLNQLQDQLKRIFSLKVSRSTFREIQNAVLAAVAGDQTKANAVFQGLLSGDASKTELESGEKSQLEKIVQEFSIPVRFCKEVSEKGDFLSIISSDLLQRPSGKDGKEIQFAFLNQLRRLDGEEFRFISDFDSTLALLNHFAGRMAELKQSDNGKKTLTEYKDQIVQLKTAIENLVG